MGNEGHQPTDKLDTSNPPNESKMIKVNSKVFIKTLIEESIDGLIQPPTMIVEGLYHGNRFGVYNIKESGNKTAKLKYAKCLWYNKLNELQSELIDLEILTEL